MPRQAQTNKTEKTRQLKAPRYRSFRLQKRIATPETARMPGAIKLFMASLRLLREQWRVFGDISLIYGILNILFVQGLSGALSNENASLEGKTADGEWNQLLNGIVLFTYIAGSSNNINSEAASAYQLFITIIVSLAVIWALRQVYSSQKIHIRDAFYKGVYPLVPYLLVLCVVLLQFVPVVIGAFVYSLVNASSIALSGVELLFWSIIFGLSALISLYMLCSSVIALYIVCLPDMTPMAALRSARDLVRTRRWEIMRKILFLPFALFLGAACITIPLIYVAPVLAGMVFFLLSTTGPAIAHSYLYRVYRELL